MSRVFGEAQAREDDALRALRAAFRIRAGIAALRVPGTATQPETHFGPPGCELNLVPDGQDLCCSAASIRLSDALMLSCDIGRAVDVVAETAGKSTSGAGHAQTHFRAAAASYAAVVAFWPLQGVLAWR